MTAAEAAAFFAQLPPGTRVRSQGHFEVIIRVETFHIDSKGNPVLYHAYESPETCAGCQRNMPLETLATIE